MLQLVDCAIGGTIRTKPQSSVYCFLSHLFLRLDSAKCFFFQNFPTSENCPPWLSKAITLPQLYSGKALIGTVFRAWDEVQKFEKKVFELFGSVVNIGEKQLIQLQNFVLMGCPTE